MTVSTSKDPARIAGMFDAIARRYDTLNHTLSVGLDRVWRRRAVRELGLSGRERLLDVCTGTADVAIEAVTFISDEDRDPGRHRLSWRRRAGDASPRSSGPARSVIGLDFAGEMLRLGRRRVLDARLDDRVALVRGDATALPMPDAAFDAVTIAFGIRNVHDPERACREFFRVTRPGGSLAILEFGFPRIPGIRAAYRWYFRVLLPRVGRLVSKHGDAYSYLPASVEQFPSPEAFAEMLARVGYSQIRHVPLTFGIVYLYVARKAPAG